MVERIGPYAVLGEIARGGSGLVLRGRAPDGSDVAIKLLLDPAKNAAVERFGRERVLLEELAAEGGFVQLLDSGQTPRGPWLAMPFVGGGTLRDRLARGRLPCEQALAVVRALARAIGRAHARGIVHRDLKPENVLFTDEGEPLVADLGVAKHFAAGDEAAARAASLSRTGELRGTLGYMAPEQFQSAKSVGPAADVFALGAILHECLTGERAFEGETISEIMTRVVDGRRPRTRAPDVPAWVSAVVERALAVEPARRHADGAALADALARGPAPSRLPLALVALVSAGVIGAGLLARRGREEPAAPPASSTAPAATATPAAPATLTSLVVAGTLGSSAFRHARAPSAIAIGAAPGGEEVVVTGTSDGFVHWWRWPEGTELHAFRVFPGEAIAEVHPVAGPELGALVLGANGKTVYVRPRRLALDSIKGHEARVVTAATGWKKPYAATVDETGRVLTWDLGRMSGKVEIDFRGSPPTALAFLPDDETLVIGSAAGAVTPVRLDPRKVLPALFAVKPPIRSVAISPEGDRLAVSTRDGPGFTFDLGTERRTTLQGLGQGHLLAFGPGGRLCGADPTGSYFVAELAEGSANHAVGAMTTTPGLAVSAKGELLFLSAPTAQPRRTGPVDEGHDGIVLSLVALPGGRLASAGADHTVRIWDLASGRELVCARDDPDAVVELAVAPDGSLLSSTSGGPVVVRDGLTGIARTRHAVTRVQRVRAAPDGKAFAATTGGLVEVGGGAIGEPAAVVELLALERDLVTWDSAGTLARVDRAGVARWRRSLVPPTPHCYLAPVGPGRAVATHQQAVRVFDLETGEDVWSVALESLGPVAASPDGRLLALLEHDAVLLLSAETGATLSRAALAGTCDACLSVAFAGDELFVGMGRGPIVRLRLAAPEGR